MWGKTMKKILVVLLAGVMAVMLCACDSGDYKKAMSLYESKQYAEAIEAFKALGDYKDSASMVGYCYLNDGDYTSAEEIAAGMMDTEEGKQLSYACALVHAKECIDTNALATAQTLLQQIPEDFTYNDLSAATLLEMLNSHQTFVDVNGTWNSESGAHLTMRWDSPSYWEEYEGDVEGSTTLSILSTIKEDGTVSMQGTIQIPLLSGMGTKIEIVDAGFSYEGSEFPSKIDITLSDVDFDGDLTYNNGTFSFSYVYNYTADNGFQYKYTGQVEYKTRSESL